VKKSVRDWLLSREEDAVPRLDALRQGIVAPERATWLESVAEVFRPDLRVWASLALVWLVLAGVQIGMRQTRHAPVGSAPRLSETAALDLASHERVSLLDGRY
jgi:hypothetical protein